MAKYVYSTLSAPMEYALYEAGANDLPQKLGSVFIAGGANVANKNLVTPRGVVTKVEDKELDQLLQNQVFQMHVDNGFITFSDHKVDAEVAVAEGMEQQDQSAPKTDNDFKEGKEPNTSGKKK